MEDLRQKMGKKITDPKVGYTELALARKTTAGHPGGRPSETPCAA